MQDCTFRPGINQNRIEPRLYVNKVVVFSFSKSRDLKMDDSIDDLLDQIVGVCKAGPEFLRPEDAKRYIFFLKELRNWPAPAYPIKWSMGEEYRPKGPDEPTVRTGEHTIEKLALILPCWVMSYCLSPNNLMPHFALDTAEFIGSMLGAHRGVEPVEWRTEPLIFPHGIGAIRFSKSFKRDFTMRTRLVVRAVVPKSVNIVRKYRELIEGASSLVSEVRIPAGTEFDLKVLRCHLSDYPRKRPEFPSGMTSGLRRGCCHG